MSRYAMIDCSKIFEFIYFGLTRFSLGDLGPKMRMHRPIRNFHPGRTAENESLSEPEVIAVVYCVTKYSHFLVVNAGVTKNQSNVHSFYRN